MPKRRVNARVRSSDVCVIVRTLNIVIIMLLRGDRIKSLKKPTHLNDFFFFFNNINIMFSDNEKTGKNILYMVRSPIKRRSMEFGRIN